MQEQTCSKISSLGEQLDNRYTAHHIKVRAIDGARLIAIYLCFVLKGSVVCQSSGGSVRRHSSYNICLLYTSDAADE